MRIILRSPLLRQQVRYFRPRPLQHTLQNILIRHPYHVQHIRAFCTPRGFKNFFPQKGGKPQSSDSEPSKQNETKNEKTQTSGKSSEPNNEENKNQNNKNDKKNENQNWQNTLGTTAPLLFLLMLPLIASALGSASDP